MVHFICRHWRRPFAFMKKHIKPNITEILEIDDELNENVVVILNDIKQGKY